MATKKNSQFELPKDIALSSAWKSYTSDEPVLRIPDIMEFTTSDEYLNKNILFPRQGTLLKMIFLQDELFTDYDYAVIDEWSKGFWLPEHPGNDGLIRYDGYDGCQPDILERIKINKADGRKWFREAVIVAGRRGSKGFIGGVAGAYVLWHYLARGDPQGYYEIEKNKVLSALVFAGKLAQARDNQWKDLTDTIQSAPCFAPYISRPQTNRLTVFAPHDKVRIAERERAGIKSENDMASFSIEAKESTPMAGRGIAAFLEYFDEMALITAATASAPAEVVYEGATPALGQFKKDGFIYAGSSPWQMSGQFYENWQQSLQLEVKKDEEGNIISQRPVYADKIMIQLPSWAIYKDWEIAHTIKMRRGFKAYYPTKTGPMCESDEELDRLKRANPETFRVEREARWAASMDAYFNPDMIRNSFQDWHGPILQQESGLISIDYACHGDPSKVGANFGFALAHIAGYDEIGLPHVVFDRVHHWEPGSFEDLMIDYGEIEDYFKNIMDKFWPVSVTFDQFNSVHLIQRLQQHARDKHYPKGVNIYEQTSTKALNWSMAENFKAALNYGLLHFPYYQQLELEMMFLEDKGNMRVDHPSSGPVQTKDVFDACANVTWGLIGNELSAYIGRQLGDFGITGAMQGGQRPFESKMTSHDEQIFSQMAGLVKRGGSSYSGGYNSPARSMQRKAPARSPWDRR